MILKSLGVNLLVLIALVLVGCGTSPPVRYYQLESSAQVLESESSSSKLLAVGPLHLAAYLDRPQLVTRRGPVEISIDEFQRWAEPLDSALPRVIAANLGGRKEGLAALDHSHDSFLRLDYRLLGSIRQFDVDQAGQVVLVVHWWLQDDQGKTLIPNTAGRYQVRAQKAGNAASSVKAMNQALELFSEDVAQALGRELEQI